MPKRRHGVKEKQWKPGMARRRTNLLGHKPDLIWPWLKPTMPHRKKKTIHRRTVTRQTCKGTGPRRSNLHHGGRGETGRKKKPKKPAHRLRSPHRSHILGPGIRTNERFHTKNRTPRKLIHPRILTEHRRQRSPRKHKGSHRPRHHPRKTRETEKNLKAEPCIAWSWRRGQLKTLFAPIATITHYYKPYMPQTI